MDIVEFSEFLVKGLVEDGDLVKVEVLDAEDDSKIIEIVVPEKDMKVVIGKNGKNVSALRVLINAYAYTHGMKRVKVNVDAY